MKVGDKVYLDGINEVEIQLLTDEIATVINKDLTVWPVKRNRLKKCLKSG